MTERNMRSAAGGGVTEREKAAAVLALLGGAMIWGVIWFPYRLLRDAGIGGIWATTISYALAFVLGLFIFRRGLRAVPMRWSVFWLALAAGGCNLAYVLAALSGEIVRVMLLFYLAPLWTVVLSRVLLGEHLSRAGVPVLVLSLAGAAIILWQPGIGLPLPQSKADWLGLFAGLSFALFNVLSRRVRDLSIESRVMVSFAGVALTGVVLILCGLGRVQMPTSGLTVVWLLLAIGLVLVLANVIVQYGLARLASNRAIVIMITEVGFAAVSSWLLAGETFGLREGVGGAVIIAACLWSRKAEG